MPQKNSVNILLLLKVNYSAASEEIYSIPLSFASIEHAHELLIEKPQSILLQYQSDTQEGFIYDATLDESFHQTLLQLIAHRHIIGGVEGKLKAYPGKYFKGLTKLINRVEQSHLLTTEQSNSSILYDRTLILKLFRKLDEGINPDLELTKYLSKKTYFQNTPSFAGALEYWKKDGSKLPWVCYLLYS